MKNQKLYTANLSNYLPDPDDPNYDEIDRLIPEFKKKLEERYPQCCAQCEPRVRARMQQATHIAKSDHMRRMLEKSRVRRVSSRWGWRSLVVTFAGITYSISLAGQLVWHGLGSQCVGTTGTRCFQRPVPRECVEMVQQYVGWTLALGLLSVWWNPKWQHKLEGARLVGLNAYYRLQLVVLVMRFGSWIWLTEHSSRLQPMLHSVFLVGTVVLSGMALWTVGVDRTPLVNWDYEQPALVTKTQYVPPPLKEPMFSMGSLAPATRPNLQQWRPPTPPESQDQMDWAPSYGFDRVKQPRYRNVRPSPFHSTALPKEAKAVGLPPGLFDRGDRLPQKHMTTGAMAEPKFFPPDVDTGLESIFGQVFSLGDPAPATNEASPPMKKQQNGMASSPSRGSISSHASLVSAALLLLALVLWSISDVLVLAFPSIRSSVLGFAVAVSVCRVAFRRSDALIVATAIEAVALLWIGFQQTTPFYDKLGAGVLSILAMQEVIAYTQEGQAYVSATGADAAAACPHLDPTPIARQPSAESMRSVDSVNTTSTAPAWKTPKVQRSFGMDSFRLDR